MGNGDESELSKYLGHQAVDCLIKPFREQELIIRVKSLLARSQENNSLHAATQVLENEKMIMLMKKDKKLADLMSSVMTGQYSISENQWKIISRYLYASFKHRLFK